MHYQFSNQATHIELPEDFVEVLLRLSMPSRLLTSRETGSANHVQSVFSSALKELRRQVLDFKGQL